MHPPGQTAGTHARSANVDGNIMIIESDEAPNLPPGLTPEGHV